MRTASGSYNARFNWSAATAWFCLSPKISTDGWDFVLVLLWLRGACVYYARQIMSQEPHGANRKSFSLTRENWNSRLLNWIVWWFFSRLCTRDIWICLRTYWWNWICALVLRFDHDQSGKSTSCYFTDWIAAVVMVLLKFGQGRSKLILGGRFGFGIERKLLHLGFIFYN